VVKVVFVTGVIQCETDRAEKKIVVSNSNCCLKNGQVPQPPLRSTTGTTKIQQLNFILPKIRWTTSKLCVLAHSHDTGTDVLVPEKAVGGSGAPKDALVANA